MGKNTFTYTFTSGSKAGTTQDYSYDEILTKAQEFKEIGSGSLDAVTKAGLEAMVAQGGDYGKAAQEQLSFWNNSTAVETNYNSVPLSATNTVNYPNGKPSEAKIAYGKPTTDFKDIDFSDSSANEQIKSAYDNTINSIDNNLKRSEEDIAKQREEAIRQAYSGYDKSLFTYGRNAEQLAAMGLGNSGYSDYLTGVAYGNMVGGVQGANEGADEAIRNAYANADQLRLNAEQTKNEKIAEAEKAYKDNYINLMANVGNIDENTAVMMAKAYGFAPEAVDNVKAAYGDYAQKVAKSEYDYYVANGYLTDANGNQYTLSESQLADLALKAGLTSEDTEKGKKTLAENALNESLAYVDENTPISDIQNLDVDKETKTAMSDKAILEAVKATTKTDATTGALEEVESNKQYISKDAYQEAYFINASALCEGYKNGSVDSNQLVYTLKKYHAGGQLNDADYESLKKYAVELGIAEGRFDADGVGYFTLTKPNSLDALMLGEFSSGYMTVDGKSYALNLTRATYSGGVLASIENPSVGMVTKDSKGYYVFGYDNNWHKIQTIGTSEKFFNAIQKYIKKEVVLDPWQKEQATPPEHTK